MKFAEHIKTVNSDTINLTNKLDSLLDLTKNRVHVTNKLLQRNPSKS